MKISRYRKLSLTAVALVVAAAWCYPGAAQEICPALADLPAASSCPSGECILDFCPTDNVRCTFSHCSTNPECCVYDCVCDPSCIAGTPPSGACYRIPVFCCGNGVQEQGEQCDGNDLNGQTCASLGLECGSLACNPDCSFNTSGCEPCCGNGICDPGEDCETCSQDCDSKTSGPPSGRFCCGNGILEQAEGNGDICDGNP